MLASRPSETNIMPPCRVEPIPKVWPRNRGQIGVLETTCGLLTNNPALYKTVVYRFIYQVTKKNKYNIENTVEGCQIRQEPIDAQT